jgi:3-oxoacyl-[acyl-carrier-protein] synthase-3
MKDGIDWVLGEANLEIENVDYILCHQANARILSHVQKKFNIPKEKVFMNLQHYANTSAASIPIALDEMMQEGLIKEGMKVISVGFGGGFTWSAALLTF